MNWKKVSHLLRRFVDAEQDAARVIHASDQDSVKKAVEVLDNMHKVDSAYPSFN